MKNGFFESSDFNVVSSHFIHLFNWMDIRDALKIWDAIWEDVCDDIEETADDDYNDCDIEIAIKRALFKRLNVED